MSLEYLSLGFAAACAAVLMPFVIYARSLGHDANFNGVQKVHNVPTSRLGGCIVFIAYLATLAWVMPMKHGAMSAAVMLVFCGLPVAVIGLWEDISGRVHPSYRLAASVVSAMLAGVLASGRIERLDIPLVDAWLTYAAVALPITWFMVAGACNAINLIDGAHGLAGGTALMLFAGLAAVAGQFGDTVVLAQSLAMA